MKLSQLKTLVKKGESEVLEFKTSTGSIDGAMKTICAFLNSDHGGTVIFGVKDNGELVGQEISDKTKKDIAAELNKIEPNAKIDVQYVHVVGGRQAIIMQASPGDKAPYTYDGRSFTRNQSTTIRMSKEEYLYLHNQNNPTVWEGLTNHTCKLSDLDGNRIRDVTRASVFEKRFPSVAAKSSITNMLKKFGVMVDEKLTNAAVILFCKNEQKQFMQSTLKLARFKGIDKTEFLDTKVFRGNIFDLYEKAIDFLNFSLPVKARIVPGNPNRVEEPTVPYNVLREAVTNALVHRDYSHGGGSVDIAIYDDRVNISNIGALPKGVLLNQLSKEHPSIQRNPLIAHVFYLCGKIERWGRGTLDMIQDCKKAGNPPPIYEERGGSFSVTFRFKEPIRSVRYLQETDHAHLTKLTICQKAILKILGQKNHTVQEIIEKIGLPLTSRTIQQELSKLRSLGLVIPAEKGKGRTLIWKLTKN